MQYLCIDNKSDERATEVYRKNWRSNCLQYTTKAEYLNVQQLVLTKIHCNIGLMLSHRRKSLRANKNLGSLEYFLFE